jgi:pseudouridine synthase
MTLIRLNKYLASQGIASRRKVDDMISQRRVYLNNNIALLGDKVDPEVDSVTVDKKVIPPHPQQLVYFIYNKPKYILTSASDDHGRDTVVNHVPQTPRVFPVGRLDFLSEGLVLLSNDGELAYAVTHPRFHVPKTYLVSILGKVSQDKIKMLSQGIELEDGKTAPAEVIFVSYEIEHTKLRITLYEGKKRQIRRMCANLHLFLTNLKRISLGPINLGDLPEGQYRVLTPSELQSLKKSVLTATRR